MATHVEHNKFLDTEFDVFMEEIMTRFHIPGVSIAVVHGENIESKGYGVIYEGGPPVNPDTILYAASMSKSFTAGAVGLLVDDERYPDVKWNTPVSTLIRDDFVLSETYQTENVTAVDMLTHRTGLAGQDCCSHGTTSKEPDNLKTITRKLRHLPLNKPFRTDFQYCNLMYTASSYLIEKVSGTPFYDFLQDRFLKPLSMTRTFGGIEGLPGGKLPTERSEIDKLNIAMPYFFHPEKKTYIELPYLHAPEGTGAGNMLSTARDWIKWVQSMILHTNALKPETIEELIQPRILSSADKGAKEPFHSATFRGMGWQVEHYRGHKVIGHSGGVAGFCSLMHYLPEEKFGFVVFGNSGGMSSASEVVWWTLLDNFLKVPKESRMDWIKRVREIDEEYDEEDEEVFLDRPNPPLPLPLPLESFAGRYVHPAYGEYTFKVQDGKLVADALDRTFGFWLRLEHATDLYFVAELDDRDKLTDLESEKVEAEFRLGIDGHVEKLGIDFIDEDDSEYIWLNRVNS